MNDDIDAILRRLAEAPTPSGLAATEAAVFARIGSTGPTVQRYGGGLTVTAAAAAALMGIASVGLSAASVQASPSLAPFGIADALAPSTLLASDR